MSIQEIEAEILKLPSHERARLAEILISSLEEEGLADPWVDEAERRDEELRSGVVRGVPADEVLTRLRDRLR